MDIKNKNFDTSSISSTKKLSASADTITIGSSSLDEKGELLNRGQWANPIEFILSCVNYAVGLGNVWRFPNLAFRNGGGAFLIPYIIMVVLVGLPIFLAELFVGQYSGISPTKVFARMAPMFSGLGYGTLVIITLITIYYMVIVAWTIFYIIVSFDSELGWGHCRHDYNTLQCFSTLEDQRCREGNTNTESDLIFWHKSCVKVSEVCESVNLTAVNATMCQNSTNLIKVSSVVERVLASEEFFNEYVLGVGDATWTNWGWPRWQLTLCLFAAWVIAFFCVLKGIQTAGKVVYFTALFPYVILLALLIRGAILEGSLDGILFFITPKWDQLLTAKVWGDAASQIFYSFGIACGSLVALASYNKFNNNIQNDAVIVCATNSLTAVFAGFTVFSIMGFMAHNMDMPVGDVVRDGIDLAFIAYPEAVLLMPLPQLWAVLFFIMMFVLGIGSQFAGIQCINSAIIDKWPVLRPHQAKVTASTCFACFILGLPMVCNGGVYMFTLMDWQVASWAILLLGFGEMTLIAWVYGMPRVFKNFSDMSMNFSRVVKYFWYFVWLVVTPLACFAVFIFLLTDVQPTSFNGYVFPPWADALGWMMGLSSLAPIPIFAAYTFYKQKKIHKSFKNTIYYMMRPTEKWGPQS